MTGQGTRKALQPLPAMQEANNSWNTMQECSMPPRAPSNTPGVKYYLGNKKQVFCFILFVIIMASPDHENTNVIKEYMRPWSWQTADIDRVSDTSLVMCYPRAHAEHLLS